jgi:hypothetical protein
MPHIAQVKNLWEKRQFISNKCALIIEAYKYNQIFLFDKQDAPALFILLTLFNAI